MNKFANLYNVKLINISFNRKYIQEKQISKRSVFDLNQKTTLVKINITYIYCYFDIKFKNETG